MAANSYYSAQPLSPNDQQQQHLLSSSLSSPNMHSGFVSGQSTPMKPDHSIRHSHRQSLVDFDGIQKAHKEDLLLKQRIRRLRVISRTIALLISIATFIPITLTLHKFLTTQNIFKTITNAQGEVVTRTAWANDSKVWPTWMYFAIAAVTVVLHIGIMVGYMCGVGKANKVSIIASVFTWTVLVGNLVVWCVAASLYRTEKDKDGKSNDLWGWTCSPAARAIQKDFGEVDFDRFCTVQSVSWYTGLVQVGAALLTVVIYVQVLMRRKSKKKIRRYSQMPGQYPTNY